HGYLKDTEKRKGILFLLGVSYLSATSKNLNFGEKFLRSHFLQTWNPSDGLSDVCDLKCDEKNPDMVQSMGKPVIYFYPKKEQKVSVKVEIRDGDFVTTYPKYDKGKKGWDIVAYPDGSLKDEADGQQYSYIYWTGMSKGFKADLSEGFVVRGEDTRKFLQETLKKLGLTPREYNEMIVYWLPYMERHKYNVIKFLASEYTDYAKMEITPKPDSLLRVFMVFKEFGEKPNIKEQKLPPPFVRKGFSVVEWGGSEIGGEWSVFK
ncbi:MAG: hypothetical protein HQK54_10455, partial [Oligoflexales bacterium]|nr:hypothetical protein [Oligoflexales bacterium]